MIKTKSLLKYLLVLSMLVLVGCTYEKYEQKENPCMIEVNTLKEEADDIIKNQLLKNDLSLDETETNTLILEYDNELLKTLGEFDVKVKNKDKELLLVKIKVQDTTKPTINLNTKEFELGAKIEDEIILNDNYDNVDALREELKVEGYSADKEGAQEITIFTKDSSNNEVIEKFSIAISHTDEEQTTTISDNNSNLNNHGVYSNSDSSSNDSGSSNNSSNSGGDISDILGNTKKYFDSQGNEITKEEYDRLMDEYNKQPSGCPTGFDTDFPCDYIFMGSIGNGGLYDSSVAAEEALRKLGLTAQSNPISSVHYNDGRIKHTFNY